MNADALRTSRHLQSKEQPEARVTLLSSAELGSQHVPSLIEVRVDPVPPMMTHDGAIWKARKAFEAMYSSAAWQVT